MNISTESRPKGLKERIETAASATEVECLLREGVGFEFASESTRRKWKRAASARLAELKGGKK